MCVMKETRQKIAINCRNQELDLVEVYKYWNLLLNTMQVIRYEIEKEEKILSITYTPI